MKKVVFGIDIGGTTIKCGLFYEDGTLIEKCEIPTRKEESGSHIIEDICERINLICSDRNISKEDIIGIGMGVPGSEIGRAHV